MLKPTDDELHEALAEAVRLREKNADTHHMARSLQYLAHRVHHLEAVFEAARNSYPVRAGRGGACGPGQCHRGGQGEELHDREQQDETLGL